MSRLMVEGLAIVGSFNHDGVFQLFKMRVARDYLGF